MGTVQTSLAIAGVLLSLGCGAGCKKPSKGTTTTQATAAATSMAGTDTAAADAAAAAYRAGEKVDISWKGEWWQGSVVSVTNGHYKVHYIGWGSNWDEVVPASRLRAPSGSARRGSGPN